jgi:hypothetical protein
MPSIGLFTVSADGRRFYLKDAMGIVCVFNRQGQLIARFESPVPLDCVAVGPEGSIVSVGVCQPMVNLLVNKSGSPTRDTTDPNQVEGVWNDEAMEDEDADSISGFATDSDADDNTEPGNGSG